MRSHLVLSTLLLSCALTPCSWAQNDLGLPDLPPVTASSPADSLLYADRWFDDSGTQSAEEGSGLISHSVSASLTGTGFTELIVYQLGDNYNAGGTPHPMVVAYHGFGGSAASVANLSTVDEECNARDWIFMSPTGLDDQLFGSPISQANTEAGIQWMIDNHNVDVDRIYMVGFSMGGGICLNFAARHRDPEGIMIAAIGVVSAGLDWTQAYATNPADLQALLENPFNFGGPPSTRAFWYEQASVLHMDVATYPPLPGTLDPLLSIGSNMGPIPTYITYDDQDQIATVPSLNEELETLLLSLGTTVQKRIQSGTIFPGPPILPAPHSWYVLDETECFDFLDGNVVERFPSPFEGIQDVGGALCFIDTTQVRSNEFSRVNGSVDVGQATITLDGFENVEQVTINVEDAGLSGLWPARFDITNPDITPLRVEVTGFNLAPHRLHYTLGAALVPFVDSDPLSGSLFVDVAPGTNLRVSAFHEPTWSTVLTISPDPVEITEVVTISIDAPSSSNAAWLVISHQEVLTPVESLIMTALPLPPAVLMLLGLDVNGDLDLVEVVPNDPILVGVRLPTQVVTVNGPFLESVSNLWGFYIE